MRSLGAEAQAIRGLERRYMTESRKSIYIACENLNFVWDIQDVREFDLKWREMRKQGMTTLEITKELAEYFGRDQDEVAILAMDRARRGRI